MNKLTYLFAMALVIFGIQARQQNENYLKAQKLYESGEKEEALQLYKLIEPRTAELLYNTAVVSYDVGQWTAALALWNSVLYKAKPELVKKIQHAIVHVLDEHGLEKDADWYQFGVWQQSYFSLLMLQCLALFLWFLWYFSGWCTYVHIRKIRILFLMGALFSVSEIIFIQWWHFQKRAITVSNGAIVYAGPNADFYKMGELKAGQKIKIVDENESWYKMHYHDLKGWVEKANFDIINV